MNFFKLIIIISLLLATTDNYAQDSQTLKKYQNHQSEKYGLTNVERNGKWGFIDKTGKEIIPLIYDDSSWFQNGITWCKFKGKLGMIDEKGKVIVPFIYDSANWLNDKLVVAYLNGKCGLFTNAKVPLCPIIYDYIGIPNGSVVQHNRIPVRLNNKYGYLNTDGKLVIPFKYNAVNPFQYCGLATVNLNGYYGCIDATDKTIVPFKYSFINPFEPRIAMASLNGYLGWVNTKGAIVVPFEYQDAKNWFRENGLTTVEKNGKWGAIDTAGRLFIACKYDDPIYFEGNISTEVHVNGQIGILGFSGKEIIPPKYDSASTAPGGVCLNNKWAIINKNGKEVTPFLYDWASSAEWGGVNRVRLHGNMGLVSNTTGKPLTPLKYKSIEDCDGHRYIVIYNNRYGVLDNNGNKIASTTYDSIQYAEKIFRVLLNTKWGYLDYQGKTLINLQYKYASLFRDGFATAERNGKWGSIDKKNNIVIPFQYQKAINLGGGEAIVCLKNKWGIVDRHNKIIKPIKYTYAQLMRLLDAEDDADETG
jgi:hypothetical protein